MKELPEVEMRQMSPKTRDLTGVRFGRLLVTEFCGYTVKDQSAVWKSRCDCGDDCVTRATDTWKREKKIRENLAMNKVFQEVGE